MERKELQKWNLREELEELPEELAEHQVEEWIQDKTNLQCSHMKEQTCLSTLILYSRR